MTQETSKHPGTALFEFVLWKDFHQVQVELQVAQVLQEQVVHQVLQVQEVHQEQVVHQVRQELAVHQVQVEVQVAQVHRELVLQELKVLSDHKDQQELKEL